MSVQLKLRRGTTAQHSTFTGADGEVTVDTTKETIVVHDGVTPAGYPLAREDLANVSPLPTAKIADAAVTTAKVADGAITSAKIADGTIATGDIADGAITSAKIADGTIVTADLANGAVSVPKISATGTPTSANYLRGDGTWSAVTGGGVTSFVGQTGAVDPTVFGSIGSVGFFYWTGTTPTLPNNTVAGSTLIYPTAITQVISSNTIYTNGNNGVTANSFYIANNGATYFGRRTSGNTGFQAPLGSAAATGTWRLLSPAAARTTQYVGCDNTTNSYCYMCIAVRIS